MSNSKRSRIARALFFAACFGPALGLGAAADEPAPPRRTASLSPRADDDRYLLLTDGRLIGGKISRDDTHYTVTQKLGVIRFPRRLVERSFDTVQEAYQYRLERAPEGDPAERLRLARWCLNLHLTAEAKAQLEKVLEISPEHGPAKAMLEKINQSELSQASREQTKVDTDVRQTAAEEVVEDRPGALDSAVLTGAQRRMGITGLPVIFDLPQATAIQRADQFKQYVHPVLQAYCAKCHNGEYEGSFQLVRASTARQRTPDALRANLDATLRFVDPENPAKSELLSSTLRPHGLGARRRSIFTGSNDRAYQILATWVNSLRPTAVAASAAPARGPTAGEPSESFAADRNRPTPEALEPLVQGIRTGDPRRLPTIANPAARTPQGRSLPQPEGQGMINDDRRQSDADGFPLPYMLGGPRPKVPSPAGTRNPERTSTTPEKPAPGSRDVSLSRETGRQGRQWWTGSHRSGRGEDAFRRGLGYAPDEQETGEARPRDPPAAPPEERQSTDRRLRVARRSRRSLAVRRRAGHRRTGSIVDRRAGAYSEWVGYTAPADMRPPFDLADSRDENMSTRHLLALFDSVYILTLAALAGGIVFFTFIVAPVIFRVLGAESGAAFRPRPVPQVLSVECDPRIDRAAGIRRRAALFPGVQGSPGRRPGDDPPWLHPRHAVRGKLPGAPDQSGPGLGSGIARSLRAIASSIGAVECGGHDRRHRSSGSLRMATGTTHGGHPRADADGKGTTRGGAASRRGGPRRRRRSTAAGRAGGIAKHWRTMSSIA